MKNLRPQKKNPASKITEAAYQVTTMRDTNYESNPSNDCAICANWAVADRPSLREQIDELPLSEAGICGKCLVAFWRKLPRPNYANELIIASPDPEQFT
jgi:hypothetical protein